MARLSVFLFCLALLRDAEASIENPAGSMIFTFLDEHISQGLSQPRLMTITSLSIQFAKS